MIWWLCGTLVAIFVFIKYHFNYWTRRGFPTVEPNVLWDNLGAVVRQKKTLGEGLRDLHLSTTKPFLGLYLLQRPALLICDPALVKCVLITDFEYFHDRGVHYDEKNDPSAANIFSMPGQIWKDMRMRLSPTFTSVKLKSMFNPIVEKSQILKDYLMKCTENSDEIRLRTVVGRLNITIMAHVLFGFEMNALENPDHEFTKLGELFFDVKTLRAKFAFISFFLYPSLLKWSRMSFLPINLSKYVLNLVKSIIEARKSDKTVRNDFIQTLLELLKDPNNKMDLQSCAAQAHMFYGAGYETSASATSFCIYELCKSPYWMNKIRDEVDELMEKCNGKIEFQHLGELKVMDLCIKETLRMYPIAPLLNRECTKDYKISGTDLVISQGTPIIISNFGLQMDKRFYENPDIFDPSRFNNDIGDLPYYPFGGGPRYCIGARLGLIMMQVSLCTLIYNFEFEAIDTTVRFQPGNAFLVDNNSVHLKIKRRERLS